MVLYDMLRQPEKDFHNALVGIANKYGPIDQNHSGIWVGYASAAENSKSSIGVMCGNCSMYKGDGGCMLLSYKVEAGGLCRLAAIPDNLVDTGEDMNKQAPCWDGYVQRGMKPGKDGQPVPNCVPATTKAYQGCDCAECLSEDVACNDCDDCGMSMDKADGYTPNSGMKAAARRSRAIAEKDKVNKVWQFSPFVR